ncbi:hypothetical protein DOTSEDRAFT_77145, partial [Dothistroma septosporum NZE10]
MCRCPTREAVDELLSFHTATHTLQHRPAERLRLPEELLVEACGRVVLGSPAQRQESCEARRCWSTATCMDAAVGCESTLCGEVGQTAAAPQVNGCAPPAWKSACKMCLRSTQEAFGPVRGCRLMSLLIMVQRCKLATLWTRWEWAASATRVDTGLIMGVPVSTVVGMANGRRVMRSAGEHSIVATSKSPVLRYASRSRSACLARGAAGAKSQQELAASSQQPHRRSLPSHCASAVFPLGLETLLRPLWAQFTVQLLGTDAHADSPQPSSSTTVSVSRPSHILVTIPISSSLLLPCAAHRIDIRPPLPSYLTATTSHPPPTQRKAASQLSATNQTPPCPLLCAGTKHQTAAATSPPSSTSVDCQRHTTSPLTSATIFDTVSAHSFHPRRRPTPPPPQPGHHLHTSPRLLDGLRAEQCTATLRGLPAAFTLDCSRAST